MTQTPKFQSFTTQTVEAQAHQQSSQQIAAVPALSVPPEPDPTALPSTNPRKKKFTRIIAIVIILALAVALYFIWHTSASTNPPPVITQQNFSGTSSNSGGNTGSSLTTNGDIHVYVVGSVKHPGVYTLPSGARVYQLLEAAGGALPNANLVALNLAAPLSDGEEVYVLAIGEKPPTYVLGDMPLYPIT
jgi:competence protein ComEA